MFGGIIANKTCGALPTCIRIQQEYKIVKRD